MSIGCVSIATITRSANGGAEDALIARWTSDADRSGAEENANASVSQRFLLGRALVRALVDRTTDIDGRDCRILSAANGKPFVRTPSGTDGPAISISHSGAMVVAAATDLGPLGIDVEFNRPNRPFDALAAFAFGPTERRSAGRSPNAFYRIWCLREAMSKATGKGLAEATNRIDQVSGGPDNGAWKAKIGSQTWLLAHMARTAEYSLAIAVQLGDPAPPVDWTEASLDLWDPTRL